MKLPILGILTIVVLQLGYTAYNAMDRPIASLYPVKRVATGADPIAVLPDESDTALDSTAIVRADLRQVKDRDINFSRTDRRRQPGAAVQKITFQNTVIRIPPAKSLMPQLIAMQKSWDSAAPTRPQPMRSGGESENFPLPAERSSEKRSFVSKSASVLKKPYDWIKALGSKLN